jgi:UDP-N-acetylmuramoylalanine--D-glutamate ligase
VLELSSWQLEGLGEAQLSPRYACVTNLSPDHLNRYGGMADYAEAKKQIFRWQGRNGVLVLNGDDIEVASWANEAPGTTVWFGARSHETYSGFQSGACYDDAGVWWSNSEVGERQIEHLCTLEDIRLVGRHNLANVAAAAALVKSFGSANTAIHDAVRAFAGVPHRLELVRELGGVRYVNDTTATAPEAAVAALHSFDAPIVLICGGADKDLPFDGMARAAVERAKAVVLLNGTATPRLQRELRMKNEELRNSDRERFSTLNAQCSTVYDTFAHAVAAARELAAPGDVELLSPGCASFGMFSNEFHRGDEFRRIVNGLSG